MTIPGAAMTDVEVTGRSSLERIIGLTGIVGMVLLFAATIATATNEPESTLWLSPGGNSAVGDTSQAESGRDATTLFVV